jgi:hypothetical protein
MSSETQFGSVKKCSDTRHLSVAFFALFDQLCSTIHYQFCILDRL